MYLVTVGLNGHGYLQEFLCHGVFLLPKTLNPIYKIWMRFGLIMSKITTPLILGLLFFIIITPMAFLVRIFKSDPMTRKLDHEKKHIVY